jgi:alpha-glucosidase (family GH31 glycosyl hydrolase)
VLRPLFCDFADSEDLRLGTIDDQFMAGPQIMHAPFTKENQTERSICLPPDSWIDMENSEWIKGRLTDRAAHDGQNSVLTGR